ncbi:MAG: serine hydrolase domain-containing protein [Phycisphaerae bacterium]|nr:serine hydrolase domain-containing protein [Phycisphaerae bacterium]
MLHSALVASIATLFAAAPPSNSGPPATTPAVTARADNFASDVADIAAIAKPIVDRYQLPGLAIAVVSDERLVALGTAGVRERNGKDRIERGDRFHLGSCTKAVTATLAAELISRGSLGWQKTVGELLGPSLPNMHEAWKLVSLEELLHHRGGAPASPNANDWGAAWKCEGSPEECRAEFVASMLARPPAQARGTYVYSNQGYAIVGRMCEIAAGKDWESLLVERVLAPLGVTSAGFGPPWKATARQAPRGHSKTGEVNDIDNPAAIGPSGTLHLTMEDWARFIALHLRGETKGGLGVTANDFKRLHTAADGDKEQYACGWTVAERPWAGGDGKTGRVLTHSGSNTVWFCVAWLAPDRRFAVIVACNQGGDYAAKGCDQAAGQALRWWQEQNAAATKSGPAIDK